MRIVGLLQILIIAELRSNKFFHYSPIGHVIHGVLDAVKRSDASVSVVGVREQRVGGGRCGDFWTFEVRELEENLVVRWGVEMQLELLLARISWVVKDLGGWRIKLWHEGDLVVVPAGRAIVTGFSHRRHPLLENPANNPSFLLVYTKTILLKLC